MNLLPCPFCGKEPEEDDEDVCYPSGTGWKETRGFRHYVNFREVPMEQWCYSVHCVKHHGGCGVEMHGDSEQEAIDRWNRRV